MDYAAALAKLRTLEVDGATDLVSAIEAKVTALEGKNYEVVGEKRTATQKNNALTETLTAIARGLNLEGELDTLLDTLPNAVQDVRRRAEELTTKATSFEQQLTEAQGKLQTFERRGKLQEIATKAGANLPVLERLFADQLDQLAVTDDGVTLGDKPLREAVEADPALAAFAPALFVATDAAPAPKARNLPGGSPAPAKPADPVAAYVNKAYGGAAKLLGNSSTN